MLRQRPNARVFCRGPDLGPGQSQARRPRARTGGCKHKGCFGPATTPSPADGGALGGPHRQDRRAFDALITQNYVFLLPDSTGKSFVRSSCFPGGLCRTPRRWETSHTPKRPFSAWGLGSGTPTTAHCPLGCSDSARGGAFPALLGFHPRPQPARSL